MIEMFQPLLFLDTETTGIKDCRLIELAWSADDKISTLRVKPPIPIEEEAIAVHGITEADVQCLIPFARHMRYEQIKTLIESSVVVAHNAPFDIGVLAREGIIVKNHIDTVAVARRLYPKLKKHNLQFLRDYFQLEVEGEAHSAKGDVAVLKALYARMAQDV